MITLAEEITLLALDKNSGELADLPLRPLNVAISASILTELAILGKITYDDFFIKSISRESTGNEVLDEAISYLPDFQNLTIENSIARIAKKGENWLEKSLARLEKNKIVVYKNTRLIRLIKGNSYEIVDSKILEDLRVRVRDAIKTNIETLSTRDIVLISIINVCELTKAVFSDKEIKNNRKTFEEVAQKNVFARSVVRSIAEIKNAILEVITSSGISI